MKFTLDGSGGQAAGQGIGSLFKAYALGPMYRQQAEQEAAAKAATAYSHTQAGNKYGAQAAQENFTLDQRRGMDAEIAADPSMQAYERNLRRVFKMTGDTNAERVAKAGTEFQAQGFRDRAVAEPNIEAMNKLIAVTADKPYLPFDNVGSTGYSINKATGTGGEINPVLAKIFQTVEQSKVNENNAQAGSAGASAGLSTARRDRVIAGLDKPVTIVDEDTGQATVTTLPTKGAPVSIGVAPSKGTGEAATNAKTRNAIIAAVEKELGGYSSEAEIAAEVEKRLARRGMNKSPSPAAAAPKIKASVPKDHKQIGTSGGKPVYQGPDGKRYIME
ncbi:MULTISPECIES: hypothetical protein [unclassified Polaromonas]|jgi:hypothetical protein|uniref:hypothetical protein n=1 Tax=unclassified Polaromonas TaxID=2638319 RepID=UPI000BDB1B1A|nr:MULTISPECIES: hypothetical protein [unclassified Polaromonas]OYZ79696.1 MAG: hypothetical protein B7Y09_09230 [Polaromonas sp. 24-63-21]OZA47276.1 MAG: hypothetical protein B7X88_22500 [Polaromonas sp. 17-63-33]HQS00794.1 hypothetical protein [Polaromonas sp.]HQS38975.1 hypothetical protein [Polaromonas sp.]HQT09539.1 hypothetical protein [Polaromonas sp.]